MPQTRFFYVELLAERKTNCCCSATNSSMRAEPLYEKHRRKTNQSTFSVENKLLVTALSTIRTFT